MADRIGDFLLRSQAMTTWQVKATLEVQRAGDERWFGEIAVALDYIGYDAVRRYIDYLERRGTAPGLGGTAPEAAEGNSDEAGTGGAC